MCGDAASVDIGSCSLRYCKSVKKGVGGGGGRCWWLRARTRSQHATIDWGLGWNDSRTGALFSSLRMTMLASSGDRYVIRLRRELGNVFSHCLYFEGALAAGSLEIRNILSNTVLIRWSHKSQMTASQPESTCRMENYLAKNKLSKLQI